jgi:hypothetical protein
MTLFDHVLDLPWGHWGPRTSMWCFEAIRSLAAKQDAEALLRLGRVLEVRGVCERDRFQFTHCLQYV